MNHIFVGVDLHKRHHTAVFLNGFKRKLGEFKFDNRPSAFPDLIKAAAKVSKGKGVIYGLEDTGGYGRPLAAFLVDHNQAVKEVNPSLASAFRKANPIVHKSDSWDAECVGYVLVDQLEKLPDANPIDHYWAISQLVTTRNSLVREHIGLINQFHVQISYHYPSYRKFFSQVDGKTALAFFERYPAPHHILGTSVEELREFLLKPSNFACSLKTAEKILKLIHSDGTTKRDYQEDRDYVVRSTIRRIQSNKKEIESLEHRIALLLPQTGYRLETMYGIDTVTAANFVAEIGDISRFGSSDKLARFAGIAPVLIGSGDKHKDHKCRQGNRELHQLFYQLACRQIGVKRGSKEPNNPHFYAYYQRKQSEGKTKIQAIICLMRKLTNIIYSLMKNKSEYNMPSSSNLQAG
ncbi:IS110 family RNA-guided transposase [Paenibacillus chitinolyticus]